MAFYSTFNCRGPGMVCRVIHIVPAGARLSCFEILSLQSIYLLNPMIRNSYHITALKKKTFACHVAPKNQTQNASVFVNNYF